MQVANMSDNQYEKVADKWSAGKLPGRRMETR